MRSEKDQSDLCLTVMFWWLMRFGSVAMAFRTGSHVEYWYLNKECYLKHGRARIVIVGAK